MRVAVRRRFVTLAAAAAIILLSFGAVRLLGLEFLPKLEEGNLWVRATLPATISLEEGNAYVNRMRRTIQSFPEVQTVVSQQGRPDDGTDAAGFFNAEFFAPLEQPSGLFATLDKDALTSRMLERLQRGFPGVEFNFSQYLQDNVAEAVSGVKGENSIKLYGNDLQQLTTTAEKIRQVLAEVPGIADLAVFPETVDVKMSRALETDVQWKSFDAKRDFRNLL